MRPRLEQSWRPGADHGRLSLALWNLGADPLRPEALCYASMTRLGGGAAVEGGRLVRRFGSHVEIAAPDGLTLMPGEAWRLVLSGLTHAPQNRTQGAMAAWIETAHGPVEADLGDLLPPEEAPRAAPAPAPAPVPARWEGPPLGLLPWPTEVAVEPGPAPHLHPAEGRDPRPFALVAALHRRLFPAARAPISLAPGPGSRPVDAGRDPRLAPGAYALAFENGVALRHSDGDGLRHGLVALAQMAHAAAHDPALGFPRAGRIADAPRFGWRGAHLDVARNMRGAAEVARLIDVLAWHRMNRLHWHLTDDEAWRLESPAFPALTEIGAVRGRGRPLAPQFADGPNGQSGAYSVAEARALVAHAAALGVEVVPEIDAPGHATALLAAIPDLRDPGEAPGRYASIQGHADNALNPALPRTYEVLETILGEAADLFPSGVLHLGGDEVPPGAWSGSPAARALAEREGLGGATGLQAHFTRRVRGIVEGLGRRMGGWDECAEGGLEPGVLLFAWRDEAKVGELVAAGHDVVATPGQALYLDMVDRPGWDAAGTSWAGPVSARTTYGYDPGEPAGPGRLHGVQLCLWAEHFGTLARLRAAAHPRLSAAAEVAWTAPEAKSWARFERLAPLMPTV